MPVSFWQAAATFKMYKEPLSKDWKCVFIMHYNMHAYGTATLLFYFWKESLLNTIFQYAHMTMVFSTLGKMLYKYTFL